MYTRRLGRVPLAQKSATLGLESLPGANAAFKAIEPM